MIRVLVSLLLFSIFTFFINFFPVLVPHFQYAGFYFMQKGLLDFSSSFIITYVELVLLIIFCLKARMKLTDKYSILFLLLPISAIPATAYSFFNGNFMAAIYLLTMLSMMPFYYQFLIKKMPYYINLKLVDYMLLSLLVAGLFVKIYQGYVHGPVFMPYFHPLLYGLISRSGGINASNHIGGILLILLPLVHSRVVFCLTIAFLLICFSRGIYFILGVYLFFLLFTKILKFYASASTRVKKHTFMLTTSVFICLIIAIQFIPETFTKELKRNFVNRLLSFRSVGQNQRLSIFDISMTIFKQSHYQGVGPANFYYAYDTIPKSLYQKRFSNPHNLYLTLLVENGPLFLIIFLYICLVMMIKAYRYDKRVCISFAIFLFYGLYSGELYETGMGKVSLYDYYYLVFLMAYVRYLEIQSDAKCLK